jgi:hypothetical protein
MPEAMTLVSPILINCVFSLIKRKDGKYLIYLPKDLAEDSIFLSRVLTPYLSR